MSSLKIAFHLICVHIKLMHLRSNYSDEWKTNNKNKRVGVQEAGAVCKQVKSRNKQKTSENKKTNNNNNSTNYIWFYRVCTENTGETESTHIYDWCLAMYIGKADNRQNVREPENHISCIDIWTCDPEKDRKGANERTNEKMKRNESDENAISPLGSPYVRVMKVYALKR